METVLPTILSVTLIILGVATAGVGRAIGKVKYELDFGEFSKKSTDKKAWAEAHRQIGGGFKLIGLVIIVVGVISLAGGLVFVLILFGITLIVGTTAMAMSMSGGHTLVKENQRRRH